MGEAPDGRPHVWAAEHGDINLITALPRATAPGLQVKVDGDWVDAVAPEGQVIINTGIMLERLTNGQIPIGWHRVVAAPGYAGERYSVVQFCHPRPWTMLSPVPSCCTPERPQRFHALSAADALDEVLYQINLVEDARARVVTTAAWSLTAATGPFFDEPTGQLESPEAAGAGGARRRHQRPASSRPGWSPRRASSPTARSPSSTPTSGRRPTSGGLATIVEQQMELADRHELRVAAVGIGCAGPIGTNCETVSPVDIPAWREFPLRERLGELDGGARVRRSRRQGAGARRGLEGRRQGPRRTTA